MWIGSNLLSTFVLWALSLSALAEPFNFGYRMKTEVGYDDNVLRAEGRQAKRGDLVAKINPIASLWKDGLLLQYEMRLEKNARHRGEDTNQHVIVGQLREGLDQTSSLLVEGEARMRYTETTPFDNNLYSIASSLEHLLAPLTSVNLGVRFGDQIYIDNQQLSWVGGTVTLGLRHRFSRSAKVCTHYAIGLKRRRRDVVLQTQPLEWDTLDARQEDWTHSIVCRFERFWAGLLAETEGRLMRNSSNSEPYSYWSTLVGVSLVKSLTQRDVLEIHGSLLAKRYDLPWLEPQDEHPQLDPEEGKDQTALILRLIHDLTEDLSFSIYYRHLRREGRLPGRYYLKNDIGIGLSLKS